MYLPFLSLVAQMGRNLPAMQETGVQSLGQEDPLEKEMATHSSGELETPIWCLDMRLSKLREMMKDKEAWMLLSMGISKSLT